MSFRKHHEKAIAESIPLTKMPATQLSELSGENEALCIKSPGKSKFDDQYRILAYYRNTTPFKKHKIDFHEKL